WSLVRFQPGEPSTPNQGSQPVSPSSLLRRYCCKNSYLRDLSVTAGNLTALALLKDLQVLTGSGQLVFPSIRSKDRPISDNTLNAALRRLGFAGDEMVAHGFRPMAAPCLNEQGWHPDVIELQLAHAERNESRGAYNRAQRLPERRKS